MTGSQPPKPWLFEETLHSSDFPQLPGQCFQRAFSLQGRRSRKGWLAQASRSARNADCQSLGADGCGVGALAACAACWARASAAAFSAAAFSRAACLAAALASSAFFAFLASSLFSAAFFSAAFFSAACSASASRVSAAALCAAAGSVEDPAAGSGAGTTAGKVSVATGAGVDGSDSGVVALAGIFSCCDHHHPPPPSASTSTAAATMAFFGGVLGGSGAGSGVGFGVGFGVGSGAASRFFSGVTGEYDVLAGA